MRYFLLFIIVAQFSCQSEKSIHSKIEGDYFIVYPDEDLKNERQRKIYAAIQDSIVTLKGVKLISFMEDGTFIQWDSTMLTGQWAIMDETMVVVNKAGKGFDNFKATIAGIEKDLLKLTEVINADGERIEVTWHLKKISSGKAKDLFKPGKNTWRQVPSREETDDEIKKRLSEMMTYYSGYFSLIAEESSYFMPIRVMLPVKFYQHAIGMKDFEEDHRFVSLFTSVAQAKKAYGFLKEVINGSDYNNLDMGSFSKEYSYMLEKLAVEIVK